MNVALVSAVLGCWVCAAALDSSALKHIANISYASDNRSSGQASIFSPRMDFEQWKPLTGRGDPLRNDPTYDYEPPVLDRVHYWADDSRPEAPPHKPDRKSEVLVLGVSSKRPSLTPRQPPRRQHRPPSANKYEDYSYNLGDHYHMTILVPPPPPPPVPVHQTPLFLLTDEKLSTPMHQSKPTEQSTLIKTEVTKDPGHLTSLYALQEANLIFQSSTLSQNWVQNNQTGSFIENAVSSDYAGWGPTTPISDDNNETHNFIYNEPFEVSKHPYSFYRPMLSEAPPPLQNTPNPLSLPTFVPTVLPKMPTTQPTPINVIHTTRVPETTTEFPYTETQYFNEEIVTEKNIAFQPTPLPMSNTKPDSTLFDMLRPMMSMPMGTGPERPEDHLYAHASENLHVYKENKPIDAEKLEFMQTMQPPPPNKAIESTSPTYSHSGSFKINNNALINIVQKEINKNKMTMRDPYYVSRLTTPMPTVVAMIDEFENIKSTTEASAGPMYLIIQGHSKVATYSSKAKPSTEKKETIDNEITKKNEAPEIKHLHPIKEKYNSKKSDKIDSNRTKYAKSLKSLVSDGVGSIEIQEADVGIKYDVSDGSEVPVEIYKKGIVESDENNYSSEKKNKREKRQLGLEDFIPFDEDTLEELVYNYFQRNENDTGITGFIATAVTSDVADAVDELEDNDEDDEER